MDPYEELRAAFTAAVSHELRTPLARLYALLESAELPAADRTALLAEARAEVERMTELVDEILFLSELESGREVVVLTPARAAPVLREVVDELAERSERAGVALAVEVDADLELPLRPRMLRVVVRNLAENALRYAGEGATCILSVRGEEREAVPAARAGENARDAGAALGSDSGREVHLRPGADPARPLGADVREVVGEVEGRAARVAAVDRNDLLVRQVLVRVQRLQLLVVPVLDAAE